MRWKRQSRVLFGIGAVLLAVALGMFIWLRVMDANANISPNPSRDDWLTSLLSDRAYEEDDNFVEVDWEHWRSVNPDIIAWVNVPDTTINYPIVRASADDPTFYLRHDIYRNYSAYGVPYLDADCVSTDVPAFNAIIYGHHMDNGSMFSEFAEYCNEDFARNHPYVYLQSPTTKQKLAVSFVEIIDASNTSKAINYEDVDAFRAWFQEHFEQACVALEQHTELNYAVTFCTCSYHHFGNERTLVVCVPT